MEYLIESIKKGLKFELIDESIAGFTGRYLGSFLEYHDDYFLITIPKMNNREYTFKKGESVTIYAHTPEGVYNIEADVLDFGDDYCKLSIPRIIKHSQRREFLRADLKIKVILNFRDREYEEQTYEVRTINVCGRGICFNFREDITYAKDIRLELFLSDRIVKTNASVVYIKPIETPEGLMFMTAMTLTTISDADVNAIVRECFLYKLKENVDERSKS